MSVGGVAKGAARTDDHHDDCGDGDKAHARRDEAAAQRGSSEPPRPIAERRRWVGRERSGGGGGGGENIELARRWPRGVELTPRHESLVWWGPWLGRYCWARVAICLRDWCIVGEPIAAALLRLHPLRAGARDTVRRAVGRLLRPARRLGRLRIACIVGAALASFLLVIALIWRPKAASDGDRLLCCSGEQCAPAALSVSSSWWSAPARSSSSSRGRASRPYCSRRAPHLPASPSFAAPRPSSSSNYGGSSGRSSAACAARPSRRRAPRRPPRR